MSKLVKASEIKNVGARKFYRALIRWFKEEKHEWGKFDYRRYTSGTDWSYCAVGGVAQSTDPRGEIQNYFGTAKHKVALGQIDIVPIVAINDDCRTKYEMLTRVGRHLAAIPPVEPTQGTLF